MPASDPELWNRTLSGATFSPARTPRVTKSEGWKRSPSRLALFGPIGSSPSACQAILVSLTSEANSSVVVVP